MKDNFKNITPVMGLVPKSPEEIEHLELTKAFEALAGVRRISYDAHMKVGFTAGEALELCQFDIELD